MSSLSRRHLLLATPALLSGLAAPPARAADPTLVEAARREGRVTWYTTQQIDTVVRPLSRAFEAKYGVRVNFVRASTSDVALRIYNEGRARQVQADVFDGSGAGENLKRENLVLQWVPENAVSELGADYVDPEGYWVANTLYVLVPTANTRLVPPGTEPKTFQDLLNPRWSGRMAWNSGPSAGGAAGFIGLVLKEMGEGPGMAYLRDLARQNIAGPKVVSAQIVDQVISGEYQIGLQTFVTQSATAARRGAPIAWIPMQPAMVVFSVMSVTNGAPHPAAAKLLVDFSISEEGQRIFAAGGLLPVHPKAPPLDPSLRPDGQRFRGSFFTPKQTDEAMANWMRIYEDVFRFR